MIAEYRDRHGRLRIPYFLSLLSEYMTGRTDYNAATFKRYVEKLGVLTGGDCDTEGNGHVYWKHRIDRAAQKYFTHI